MAFFGDVSLIIGYEDGGEGQGDDEADEASRVPHTESDSSSMAGLRPMALPMIFGVTTMSLIICTMQNTATAPASIIQKFWPVSAALSRARNTVG